jgi:probable metal-binding protein
MESKHGHELMHWLGDHGPLDRPTLLAKASEIFGADCQFHTCSQEGLSASRLLDFLLEKGKISEGPAGLSLAVQPCDH